MANMVIIRNKAEDAAWATTVIYLTLFIIMTFLAVYGKSYDSFTCESTETCQDVINFLIGRYFFFPYIYMGSITSVEPLVEYYHCENRTIKGNETTSEYICTERNKTHVCNTTNPAYCMPIEPFLFSTAYDNSFHKLVVWKQEKNTAVVRECVGDVCKQSTFIGTQWDFLSMLIYICWPVFVIAIMLQIYTERNDLFRVYYVIYGISSIICYVLFINQGPHWFIGFMCSHVYISALAYKNKHEEEILPMYTEEK